MGIKKWVMKQYWRIGQIRALVGLASGMLVVGKLYLGILFPQVKEDAPLLGALALGTFLTLLFLGLGWAYDEKGKLWSERLQVTQERNPYQYVPDLRTRTFVYPFIYALISILDSFERKFGNQGLKEINEYLRQYFHRRPGSRKDIESALPDSDLFMKEHPFVVDSTEESGPITRGAKAKLGFQLQVVRITWIQSLTGLMQDVLVFGALYAVILVPTDTPLDQLLLLSLIMALVIFMALVIAGWYYDKRLKLWSPDMEVKTERNPYTYIITPRLHTVFVPFFYGIIKIVLDIFKKMGEDTTELDRLMEYLNQLVALEASRDEDMQRARDLQEEFPEVFSKKDMEVI
ncbi:MAG: hypothetical protein RTU30_09455 [Candidatus Thorarchaeota archaeon]